MRTSIWAVYENGVFRPLTPLDLQEGQQVEVIVSEAGDAPGPSPGSILAEIAALPIEGAGDPFTSRDHDRVLYGREDDR